MWLPVSTPRGWQPPACRAPVRRAPTADAGYARRAITPAPTRSHRVPGRARQQEP
jgi:hypothetical protein